MLDRRLMIYKVGESECSSVEERQDYLLGFIRRAQQDIMSDAERRLDAMDDATLVSLYEGLSK